MEKRNDQIAEVFGNRLRVRVSGICVRHDEVLLINHRGLNDKNEFWAPPGGGMELGYTAEENLVREFKEETGLDVEVEDFLCVHEFLNLPLHAVELFFRIAIVGGELKKGGDPELAGKGEIIREVAFKPWVWVAGLPQDSVHQLLYQSTSIDALQNSKGYHCTRNGR